MKMIIFSFFGLLIMAAFLDFKDIVQIDRTSIKINQYLELFQQANNIKLGNGLTLLVPDTKCHNCRDFCMRNIEESQINCDVFIDYIITTAIDLKTDLKGSKTILYYDNSFNLNGFNLNDDNMILVNISNGKVKKYSMISKDKNIYLAYNQFIRNE
ncbi:MAG: hypothetical protein V2A67_07265 [Bacteroidota bacterium]